MSSGLRVRGAAEPGSGIRLLQCSNPCFLPHIPVPVQLGVQQVGVSGIYGDADSVLVRIDKAAKDDNLSFLKVEQ